jgi:hypothetical protein
MAYKFGRNDYAAIRDEANDPATVPVEVSAEQYEDMLGVVPPLHVPGGFFVGECLTGDDRGNVHAHYAERQGRYFARYAVVGNAATLIPADFAQGCCVIDTVPAHLHAEWDGDRLLNGGGLPLWSGSGPAPAIGGIVPVGRGLTVKVEGYRVDGGWLMITGERSDGVRGDLAGVEIAWKLVEDQAPEASGHHAASFEDMIDDPNWVGSRHHY